MKISSRIRQRDPFRWRSTLLLTAATILGLILFRQFRVAGGVSLGLLLFAGNLLLMAEIGRSLLRSDSTVKPKTLSAVSSTGRMLFLAVSLSLIAVFLGRDVVLGACGGFLIAQVNLHIPVHGRNREER